MFAPQIARKRARSSHNMSSDEELHDQEPASPGPEDEEVNVDEVDDDTLRIMVSTDNHLGYAEKDPIRGMDSFAAFEEVLYLAKRHKVRAMHVAILRAKFCCCVDTFVFLPCFGRESRDTPTSYALRCMKAKLLGVLRYQSAGARNQDERSLAL